jgi:ergothioneine biosynthesis protein EgtC
MIRRMCRMAGYLGPPRPLQSLVDDPPHSLERQSYAHREMRDTIVNADGWGAAWYLDGESAACTYRTPAPIWSDINRASLGRTIRSRCLLAAVRSATDPLGVSAANTQPFTAESLSFLHNGYLRGFRERLMRPLREGLSDPTYAAVRGDTDSEHIFATLLEAHRRQRNLVSAVRDAVSHVLNLARQADTVALLTLMVADGSSLVGVRAATGAEPPTLYLNAATEGVRLASEALDTSDWQLLAPGIVYEIRDGHVKREALT